MFVFKETFLLLLLLLVSSEQRPKCPEDKIKVDSFTLTFPESFVGSTAAPQEFCVDNDYRPLVRNCLQNSTWSPIRGRCSDQKPSETTNEVLNLQKYLLKHYFYVFGKINDLTRVQLRSYDVFLISKILEASLEVDHSKLIFRVIEIINNIMSQDDPRIVLDSRNTILSVLEEYLLSAKHSSADFPFRHLYVNTFFCKDFENYKQEISINCKESCGKYHMILFRNRNFFSNSENHTVISKVLEIFPASPRNFSLEIDFYSEEAQFGNLKCASWKSGIWTVLSEAADSKKGYCRCSVNDSGIFAIVSENVAKPSASSSTIVSIVSENVAKTEPETSTSSSTVVTENVKLLAEGELPTSPATTPSAITTQALSALAGDSSDNVLPLVIIFVLVSSSILVVLALTWRRTRYGTNFLKKIQQLLDKKPVQIPPDLQDLL